MTNIKDICLAAKEAANSFYENLNRTKKTPFSQALKKR